MKTKFFARVLTAVVLKENANFLSLISMFYFANLAANIVFSFMQFKLNPLFPIGLTLFSFCDILIGLEMLDNFMTIPETSFINKINDVQINLAWAFYVPSQTLISLSSINIFSGRYSRYIITVDKSKLMFAIVFL